MKNTTLDVNFRAHFRTDKAGLRSQSHKPTVEKNISCALNVPVCFRGFVLLLELSYSTIEKKKVAFRLFL